MAPTKDDLIARQVSYRLRANTIKRLEELAIEHNFFWSTIPSVTAMLNAIGMGDYTIVPTRKRAKN
jgi:hypothetical protein